MVETQNNSINFQKLYQLMQEEKFTDTVLLANDSKKFIKCHKLILISSSEYFEEIFNLLETQNINNTTIVLRDISHEILHKILKFIYCGKVELEANQIFEFKRAANYLKINSSFIDDTLQTKRDFENELDISLATQMSQDPAVDDIINDFSMNSSISTILDEETDSDETDIHMKKHSIALAKSKNKDIEPTLKKAKIDTWIYKPEIKPEKCKYCHRLIHESNPAYHHQRHCFLNDNRVPLKCQQCHEDFDFVMNLREHNLKIHRER